jgi:hypothetical protein
VKRGPRPLVPHAHCSQIHGVNEAIGAKGYEQNLYCANCPEADLIPKGCRLDCGFPFSVNEKRAQRCLWVEDCPCASIDSPERAAAIAKWQEGQAQRAQAIKQAFKENA